MSHLQEYDNRFCGICGSPLDMEGNCKKSRNKAHREGRSRGKPKNNRQGKDARTGNKKAWERF